MSKSFKVDLTGQRFGRLTVLEFVPTEGYTPSKWLCQCDCGNKKIVTMQPLIEGRSKSCGCFSAESTKERFRKHAESRTRLYRIWAGIKRRCLTVTNPRYAEYGGRGIKICDEWENSFVSFRDWAMSHGYADNLSIDRIDVDGNYEPSNCRWTDMKTQQRNRRNNIVVEYQGEMITLAEAAEILGINYSTMESRYQNGDRGEKLLRPINDI